MKKIFAILLSCVLLFTGVFPCMAVEAAEQPADETVPANALEAVAETTAADGLTLTVKTTVPVNNGTVTVAYPAELKLVSASSAVAAQGVSTVNTATAGQIVAVWAATGEAKAGEAVLTMKFTGEVGEYAFGVKPGALYNNKEKVEAEAFDVTGSILHNCPSAQFADIDQTQWYHEGVDFVVSSKLMYGVSATKFAPATVLDRATVVTVLYRAAGAPKVEGGSKFTDVPAGQWYSDAIAWAQQTEIAAGFTDGTFRPTRSVTRQDAMAFLFRYAKLFGLNTDAAGKLDSYPDVGEVAPYAKEAFAWAVGNGVISGNLKDGVSYLDPRGAATRGQYAVMITNLMALVPETYLVTFAGENAVALVDDQEVKTYTALEGETLVFQVKAAEGYEIAAVSVGDTLLTPDKGGIYTLTVQEDTTVTILAAEILPTPETVKVTLVGENCEFFYEGEKVTEITVEKGTKYVLFNILGTNGYHAAGAEATNGAKLTQVENLFMLSAITADTTVTARMELNVYNVSFSYPNNTYYLIPNQSVTHGQQVVEPKETTPLREGRHLIGWFADAALTQPYDFETPVTGDLVLYSDWELDEFTVTFHSNGGSEVPAQTVQYGKYPAKPVNPKKEGYTFAGWFTDEELTQPYRFNVSMKADLDLYADWFSGDLQDVYLDGRNGNDDNNGTNDADAVKTFAKAKELLEFSATKVIRISGSVTVSDAQTWDLGDVEGAYVARGGANTSYLFVVNGANANLTLSNITFKGAETASYMFGQVNNSGTLNLNEGAVFEDNVTSNTTSALYATNSATINFDGGIIRNCTTTGSSGYGAIQFGSGCTLNFNSGSIENCLVTGANPYTGALYVSGATNKIATLNLNGGKITGCGGENSRAGAIYSNNANSVVVLNGTTLENNTGKFGELYLNGVAELKSGVVRATENAQNSALYCAANTGIQMMAAKAGDLTIDGKIYIANTSSVPNKPLIAAAPLANVAGEHPVELAAAILGAEICTGSLDYIMTEDDMQEIQLLNDLQGMLKLALKANTVSLAKTKEPDFAVYLDGKTGSDHNDGLTAENAVGTFAKAKEILAKNAVAGGDNYIYVVGTVYITSEQTWSLAGIDGAKLVRGDTFKDYMIVISDGNASFGASGDLILEDITIDGNGFYNNVNAGTMIRVNYGTVTINDGTVLCNNGNAAKCPSTGSALYIYGRNAEETGKVVMNGGLITGNYASTSGTVYMASKFACFTMNGGAITGNFAKNRGAGIMDNNGANVQLIGGSMYGNTLLAPGTGCDGSEDICIGSAAHSDDSGDFVLYPGFKLGNNLCVYRLNYSFVIPETFANRAENLTVYHGAPNKDGDTLIAKGTADYQITAADLAKLTCGNEGYTFKLDAENNRILMTPAN